LCSYKISIRNVEYNDQRSALDHQEEIWKITSPWRLRSSHLLLMISCLAYSPTLRIEAICYSETWGFLRTKRRYNPENRDLHSHLRDNLRSNNPSSSSFSPPHPAIISVLYESFFPFLLFILLLKTLSRTRVQRKSLELKLIRNGARIAQSA
jgi:hypothetical protein